MEERDSSGVRTQFYSLREVFLLTFSHCPHTKENRVYSIAQTD